MTNKVWEWLVKKLGNNAPVLAVLGMLLLLAGSKGRDVLAEEAKKQVDPVAKKVDWLEKKQDRYEADVHEFGQDLRELYRVTPTTHRSERLERPFPSHDAGEP